MLRLLSGAVLSLFAAGLVAAPRALQGEPAEVSTFVCPPCGAECHSRTYAKQGNCGVCGMELVALASVPQVGVLILPSSTLGSSTSALATFQSSYEVRAFAVSDTDEPVRLDDTLEVRPQFRLDQAPPLDVLVLPDGFGAWEDELVVDWVRTAAAQARCVVAIGKASVLLAKAGFLAGERVPADRFLAQRGSTLGTELVFDAALATRRVERFFLARDVNAGIDASLAVLGELRGEACARATAERLGHPWSAPAAAEPK